MIKNIMKVFAERWENEEVDENVINVTLKLMWKELSVTMRYNVVYSYFNLLVGPLKRAFLVMDFDKQVDKVLHDYAAYWVFILTDKDVQYLQDAGRFEIINFFFFP